MSINAIWDAIKGFAQSFNVSTIFPATLLVIGNGLWVLPVINSTVDITSDKGFALVGALVLMVSYTLYAFNFPIIRILEGYKLKETSLFQSLLQKQRAKYDRLTAQIRQVESRLREKNNQWDEGSAFFDESGDNETKQLTAKLAQLENTLDQDFPTNPENLLPTALGGVTLAFENHARTRYGIDSVAAWPRFIPILRENKYIDFVTQEKTVFDFLLNTGLVTALLGVELFWINLYLDRPIEGTIIFCGMVAVVWIIYRGLVIAARQWGTTVRAAFDLYRHDLYEQLGIRESSNWQDERKKWEHVSTFLFCRRPQPEFEDLLTFTQRQERDRENKPKS